MASKKNMPCNKVRRSTRPGKKKMVKACEGGREKLIHFASKTADGKSDYFGYCVRERRDVLTVFKDFGVTNQIPLAYLIQGIGRQRPREFSISSAYSTDGEDQVKVDLTMAVTEYETKFKRKITGVCSLT